jgi:hypothetical protein
VVNWTRFDLVTPTLGTLPGRIHARCTGTRLRGSKKQGQEYEQERGEAENESSGYAEPHAPRPRWRVEWNKGSFRLGTKDETTNTTEQKDAQQARTAHSTNATRPSWTTITKYWEGGQEGRTDTRREYSHTGRARQGSF